jgi:hypothetical protein
LETAAQAAVAKVSTGIMAHDVYISYLNMSTFGVEAEEVGLIAM